MNQHNHPLGISNSVKHRSPNPDVINEFKQLFEEGLGPNAALEAYKQHLRSNNEDNFHLI